LTVRPLRPPDVPAWMRLRCMLWPEVSTQANDRDYAAIVANPDTWAVFVADDHGELAGFIESSLRPYADGCDSSPVGYVEGWFVLPQFRNAGVGKQLVAAAESWARSRGCVEMASDSLLDNLEGQRAHAALGYHEVERAIRYRKTLT
jgi:aminoglycoside 6'-N-acetyltransferase I